MNRIELSRSALLHNLSVLMRVSGKKKCIPVLKANAYGHGLKQVAQILGDAPTELVAVDGYHEALLIHEINPEQNVLVMGAIDPQNFMQLHTTGISYVAHDVVSLKGWADTKRRVRLHLEFNTGMNRQGFNESDLLQIIEILHSNPQIRVEGIMSHLADADNPKDTFNHQQVEQFDRIVKICLENELKPYYIHLGQSAGSVKIRSTYANTIRPGIALYGINPLSKKDPYFADIEQTKPVLRFISRVGETRQIIKGEGVSYNLTFKATKPQQLATLPVGYYEALPRALSNQALFKIKDVLCPVVGRICMNHTMIAVSNLSVGVGDEVEIISDDRSQPNSLQSLADQAGMLNYEFMVHINESVRRVIVD